MIRKRIAPLVLAVILCFGTVLAAGQYAREWTSTYIKPGVIATATERLLPTLFQGTILQSIALQYPNVVPMYGSSEFDHGGKYNPMRLFADRPTGWTPYLVGQPGCTDIIQALFAGAQNLRGKHVIISVSDQWFHPGGVAQKTFAANFSALQAYEMLLNPDLTTATKRALAQRLSQFTVIQNDYPVLERILMHYGQNDPWSRLKEALLWPAGRVELASLQIQDALNTVNVVQHLPAKEIARNAAGKTHRVLHAWPIMLRQATAAVAKNETNNPFGINNQFFTQQIKPSLKKFRNSALNARLYPSPEYADLDLLLQVLHDEGAHTILLIQPINGRWYDYTGFPKQQLRHYVKLVHAAAGRYGVTVADFSGHAYDKYFMDDPSHPSEKGWLEFDETLDRFVHQTS